MKRVVLLGNMNNNLFNMCRFLRDRGFDATLYIYPYDSTHFLPEADSFDDSYKDYVNWLKWGNPYELSAVSAEEIRALLNSYDFIIGCGTTPAYVTKAGLTLDLFTPYGSDLYHFPFFNSFRPAKFINYFLSFFSNAKEIQQSSAKSANWKGYIPFVLNQRKGIRQSRNCAVLSSGQDIYGQSLKRLGFANRYFRFTVPNIYAPQYTLEGIKKYYSQSKWYDKFNKVREGVDFLIFSNCRHCWKYEKDPASFKGNDRLFQGFAEFIKTYKGKAAIITFEYGTDYPESQKLCKELGIEKYIHWFPLLPRKELLMGMSLADLVAGNLSDASWSTYGVVYESMALSKPVMHHRDDELYSEDMLYPMLNAYSVEMVNKVLSEYSSKKEELKAIGEQAHKWFIEESIDKPVQQIVDLINNKKGD